MIKRLYKKVFGFFAKDISNKVKNCKWGDINYLHHDFSNTKTNDIDMRECKKCGIFVHYYHHKNRYNTFDPDRISGFTYPTLNLTCEEVIIKKLLE